MTPDLNELAIELIDTITKARKSGLPIKPAILATLKQAVEQGERENANLKQIYEGEFQAHIKAVQAGHALKAELARVKAQNQKLRKYADHNYLSCLTNKCICGLDDILAEVQKEGEAKECRKDS